MATKDLMPGVKSKDDPRYIKMQQKRKEYQDKRKAEKKKIKE